MTTNEVEAETIGDWAGQTPKPEAVGTAPTRSELPEFARNHQLGKLARRTDAEDVAHVATEGDYDAETELVEDPADAEVVLSLTGKTGKGGPYSWLKEEPLHRPIIDLDFPAVLVPSSTPGHHHLYIDKEMPWSMYKTLLSALAEAGLIEPGYRDASLARNFTSVRMPSVKKARQLEQAAAVTEPPVAGAL